MSGASRVAAASPPGGRRQAKRANESYLPAPARPNVGDGTLALVAAARLPAQRGLRRGQTRDRDPERRARHVIESGAMAELDARGIAAVLSADADLELGPRLRPRATAHSISAPTPSGSMDTNGSVARIFRCRYSGRNLPASSRENPNVSWVRSLVPNEKNSASSAIRSAVMAARGTSIIVPTRYSTRTPCFVITSSAMRRTSARLVAQLLHRADERDHDLRQHADAGLRVTAHAASKIARACISVISG